MCGTMEDVYSYTRSPAWEELVSDGALLLPPEKRKKAVHAFVWVTPPAQVSEHSGSREFAPILPRGSDSLNTRSRAGFFSFCCLSGPAGTHRVRLTFTCMLYL